MDNSNNTNNPNRYVMADSDRCIACNTCMAACYESAVARDLQPVSNLIVGTSRNGGTMPNQCRQCQEAECVEVCPVSALVQEDDYVSLDEVSCIGCGKCVKACPFDAIHTHKRIMTPTTPEFAPAPEGKKPKKISKKVAYKCDLCEGGETGPACVSVCPTNALYFYNSEK